MVNSLSHRPLRERVQVELEVDVRCLRWKIGQDRSACAVAEGPRSSQIQRKLGTEFVKLCGGKPRNQSGAVAVLMEELRKFITVDNHEVKIGHQEEILESLSVVMPKFTTDFLEAVVREGADELTLPRGGSFRTFVGTMWETADESLRSWTRTGTPSVIVEGDRRRRGRNGRTCTTSTLGCTERPT